MNFAKIKKCRDKKRKQKNNAEYYAQKVISAREKKNTTTIKPSVKGSKKAQNKKK